MALRSCLSNWFPKVAATGVLVPDTAIVKTAARLPEWVCGEANEEVKASVDALVNELTEAAEKVGGFPVFLRTGQTSAKHYWRDTCFVERAEDMASHVTQIATFSEMADMIGLPCDVWAVRRIIETKPMFEAFQGRMPIVREFRAFVEGGRVHCIHPYWPRDSIREPSIKEWAEVLNAMNDLGQDAPRLAQIALQASFNLSGAWSIDMLFDAKGDVWVTDLADAGSSWHWPECRNASKWPRIVFE